MKKLLALLLAVLMLISMAACGGKKDEAPAEDQTEQNADASTDAGETDVNTDAETDDGAQQPVSEDTAVVCYGTNYYEDEDMGMATIHLPEGAYFDEDDFADYKEQGSVFTMGVYDEVREYAAYSKDYWNIEASGGERPAVYEVIQQLYFEGELDEETAAEYSDYAQTVTDLGFQWEGMDVIHIATNYTSNSGFEYDEIFVGVEYEFKYWRAKENGGTEDLTTHCLFGFYMYSTGVEDLTIDQCAWIAGQLFGVDSGRTWELEGEAPEEVVVDVNTSEVLGTWLERDSDWNNTYTFKADGSGLLVSGPEYPYTFKVSGDVLTLTYDDGESEEFTVTVDGDVMTWIDSFGNEIVMDKQAEDAVEEEPEEVEEPEEAVDMDALAKNLIGRWLDVEAGYNESFSFKEDGRGVYTWIDEVYEYDYELSDDYLRIYFDDGDFLSYYIAIDGDSLILDDSWTLTRQ